MQNQEMNMMLEEILAVPSQTVIADRFAANDSSSAAPCTGICTSGMCRPSVL